MSDGIPNGWVETSLDSVAIWSSGGTPSRTNPLFFSGTIPWLKTGELGERFIFDSEEKITSDAIAASSAKVFPRGSVVLAMYGATIGKASILGVDSATNQACAVGTPDAVDSRLLYYFLLSQHQAFVDAGKGGAQPNISQGIVKNWPFLLPPSNEQTRIVEKLEELFTDLDAGVAELKAAQKKLAQYRQSLLKAAVEGELTAEWRRKNKPKETGAQLLARILKERRARWEAKQLSRFKEQGKTPPKGWQDKYPEPVQPNTTNLPELPEGWVWTGFEALADGLPNSLKAGPFGSALKKEYYVSKGYKVYGQEQVIRDDPYYGDYYISEVKYRELISCAVKPKDILVSLVGTTGKVLVLPDDTPEGIINPRLLKISLLPCNVDPNYLKLVLESPYARHFFKINAHGGTMEILNLGILKSLPVMLPSIEEQKLIVETVNNQKSEIDRQVVALEFSLTQAAAQRKNILKSAFSGQLVPQDPSDEPASVLLERIRAERQKQTNNRKPGRNRKKHEANQ